MPARAARPLDGGGDVVTDTAFVIPADPAEPCRTVTWTEDGELLALLRDVIRCEWVETVSVEIHGAGTLVGWVDEEGIFAAPRIENHRFNTFAANLGQPRRVFGTVVLTGDADDEGATLGLHPELLADLAAAIAGVTA